MLRVSLCELCLQIRVLDLGQIEAFLGKALQPPSAAAIVEAVQTLRDIHAMDEEQVLSPLGYHLAALPVDVSHTLFNNVFTLPHR